MSMFERFQRVVKSNLNSLADQAEDPGKVLDQLVLDLEAELRRSKQDRITQLGTAKRLEKKAEEHAQELQEWEDKAVLALRAGDEGLARDALKMKQKVKASHEGARRQAEAAASAVAQLADAITQAEVKLEDLKARKGTLAAQVRRARSTGVAGAPSGAGLSGLEALTGRIDQLEGEIEAAGVLDDPDRARVDARFRELERTSGGGVVEDELAALKRKLEQG